MGEHNHPYLLSKSQSDTIIEEIKHLERFVNPTVDNSIPVTMVRLVEVIAAILSRTDGMEV